MVAPLVPAVAVYDPTQEQAHRDLSTELAQPEYADALPNPILEFLGRVWAAFLDWVSGLNGIQPNLGTLVVVLLLLGVVAVAVLVVRPRLRRHAVPAAAAVGLDTTLRAEDYRARAARAQAAADFSTACLERFRALVRHAEERAFLDPQPGRTASEVSSMLAAVFPARAQPLHGAADLFNAVHYGDHEATAADAARLAALDAELATAAPSDHAPAGDPARLAVPR